VADQEPELLRYLAGLGLHLHARLLVTEKGPFEGPIQVRVQGDRRTHSLSRRVTDHIYVAVGTPQQRR
jgi:Fe2+ transport system protein FeoA